MTDVMTAVAAALTEAAGWTVDQHVSYDGSVMIVADHSRQGQTFTLSGPVGRLELSRVEGDHMLPCGTFERVELALSALQASFQSHQR